ncbi:SpaH/EbpB family LPXTG-anchored major pilin [Dysosmobacter sp.]|jgi:fimbrial isopeptide formation D2 family protein/LPXTG-motif cell wall-anchored protein
MKTMRKLFTVLLALAMTLALAVPAFAADTTGSITITNPQGDRTYTAYKIFDVTYSGKNYSYTISGTDAAFNTVKAYADEAANGLKLTAVANTNKYNVSIDAAAFSAASFAQYLKTNVGSLGTGTAFTKDGDTMKASGLTPGYYFVSGTSGTVCELATAKDIEIRDKNEALQIEKSVDDADRTVEIGQKLTYTITGKVPSTKGYTKFTYQVTDTMSEGLTFNKDVKVTIGGTAVTDAAITYNDNGFVASINMMNYQKQIDAPVVITYTATVNENAIQRDKETNTATLKYSNDPADKNSFKESSVEVNVFSFNIVINKYAAGNENTKLAGAKFVLKNNEGKYYKYDAAKVTWVDAKADATEVITGADGAARFDGLQAGTYYLEETAAPAGYNQLTKDITIVLNKDGSATIDSASSTLGADHSLTAGVANSTGTMLPETGGIGTVIFVALGALAVICAGVFLVTNKRMSKESF